MYFRIRALLATMTILIMASGCSIMHPVADDYGQYLTNNQKAGQFQQIQVANQYQVPAATQNHHYEFRSAMVGYAHVWAVDFGKILDATMQSKDVVDALGPLTKAAPDSPSNGNTLIFDLDKYSFEDFGAHIVLTIRVKNASGEVFKKTYTADGETQGGKMFWSGPFGMKNAVQQSTKLAMDKIFTTFIADVKTSTLVAAK
ncbi:hypothetical protein [Silvimonas sp.]|uniref:hypothetical protein n=1 Tax=Silvimonas sp. TaxID=2650811 RepID=UPI002845A981|nr:hypothetical protein [Silvimonas sp.]MDR3427265.1 hypothetical protein [Silvimonas sp.]